MALDLFEELGAAPPPPVAGGRDLFGEFGVSAQPASSEQAGSGGRDLFAELGVDADELARASRPVTGITRRGPRRFLDAAYNDDEFTPRSAPWTGEGGVLESLPAQMVAGTRNAVANLKRMLAEESATQRRSIIEGPAAGETPAGAVTGRAVPGSIERQSRRLAQDQSAIAAAERDAGRARGDLQLVTPHGMNTAQQAVSSLAQSAPPTLLGISAAILTRNPALAMTIAGGGGAAVQAGSTYGEAREKGATHRLSATAATIDAILEGVGEALPMRIALKPGSPILTRIYSTMAAEAGQEAATQAMQDLNAYATYNPDITFNEAWHNLKVAALAGAMGGAAYGGAGAAMARKPAATAGQPEPVSDLAGASAATPQAMGAGSAGPTAVDPTSTTAPIAQPPAAPSQPGVPRQPVVTPAPGNEVAPVSAPAPAIPDVQTSTAVAEGVDLFERLGVAPPPAASGSTGGQAVSSGEAVVDQAAHEAATSPSNALPEPTNAQKEAGNFAKGHVRIGGLDISIENPIGSERTGTDPNGEPWSVTMTAHYGYVRRTEGKDGEQVDVYVARGTPQDWSGPAFVVDQVNPATGRFDEHKAVIGVKTREDAINVYDAHFSDGSGPRRRATVTQMPMEEFKAWLRDGNLKAPAAAQQRATIQASPATDDTSARNAPGAPTASTAAFPGNLPRATAQAPGSAQPRTAAMASEAGGTPPIAASTPQAWPEDVPTVVYRGSGRATKGAAYGGVALPIAGEGRYFTFSREAAKRYGPNVEEARTPVRNPLVIRSGAEWIKLIREAGWGVANPFGKSEDETRAMTQRLRDTVQAKGHDGLIVTWDDSSPYDIDPKTGADIKLLRKVFGEPQVVAYGTSTGPAGTPASEGITAPSAGQTEAAIVAQAARDAAESVKEAAMEMKAAAETMAKVAKSSHSRASPPIDTPDPDLAATAVGRRAYAPPATATERVDADQARPDQIRQAIRNLFNVPINEKHVTIRRAAGIYKVKPQAIRVRNQNDLDVIAHEVGHHFSETKPRVRGLMKKHEGELLAITPNAYAKEPKALRREEGFAEFVRLYLTQQAEARRLAPQFMKEFDAFIQENPHYRAAFDQVRGMVDQWFRLDPVERIMAKVGGRPKSIAERLGETFGKDRLIFEALDNWHPLKLMVADLKPGIAAIEDPFKAAHLLSGDAAIIEDWLTNGTVPYDPTKRADPRNYGKPLHDILKPVAKDLRRFSAYLIAKRAEELKRHGKENLFTDDEIAAGLALETPTLKAAADEVYAYNDRLLDYAVEGGLLSKDAADQFREYTAYIPFFREAEDGAGGRGKGSVFHRLLGGTENLRDPISNIIQNTANIVHATNRNAVLAKAYQLAQAVPGGGRWIEAIPMPKKAVQVATERILEQLKKEGVAIDTTMAEDLAAMQTFFQPNALGDDRHRITVVKINGEPKALQVNNRMLWQALQAFEPLDIGIVGTALAVPSDLLRAGVTLSPEFMARNFMRDTLSGFMQSKRNLAPFVGTAGGFKEVATRSDAYKLYRAFGGAYGDLWKGESEQTRQVLERMAKRGKFDPRTILTPSGLIEVLHRMGSISEAGTRVAEFKKTAGLGKRETEIRRRAKLFDVDTLIDAAYNAREVSVDFGMHGHNQAVRMLTRITPFLNPAMQGFYKMARTGRDQFFTTLLRGSMLTAFSVALFLMNRDEDWYDDIEKWERNVYWHIDVGLRDDQGKAIPLRLPKPFEWGALFGSIPEALTQVATDLQGSKFAKRLQSIFEDVFALRAVPTAVLVPAELWANKNTFTDRPIVPEAKEKLDPELQFTPGSSLTAREVGAVTGTSPVQIDHAVRGFLGTMGVYSVMLADQALRLAGDYPEPPAPSWRQIPVVKAFVRDPDNPNSRHVNEFYELLNKARRAEASHKKHEGEAADAYYTKHKAVIDMATDANKAAREMAGLRKDNEDITSSREYTGREKRQIINRNNAMIREIAKGINVEAMR